MAFFKYNFLSVADNGIPPPSYRTINVEVHCKYIWDKSINYILDPIDCFRWTVPPLIRTEHPSIGVANGSSVVLECFVEAFPESLCYWERADGRSIDSFHKAYLRDQGKYKVISTFILLSYQR